MDLSQDHAGRGEGALEDALRLRAETVPIGVGVTYATVAALAVWVATTLNAPHRVLIGIVLVLATVTATAIALAPVDRVLRSRWREPFFFAWSFGDIVIITVLAAADGGARSPTTLMYFLTLVFAAMSYPLWLTGVISASSVIAYLGLVLLQPGDSAPGAQSIWLFAAILGIVALMCIWQARVNARQLPQTAAEVAERVRATLAERILATPGSSSAPADGTDIEALVRVADGRLYARRRAAAPAP